MANYKQMVLDTYDIILLVAETRSYKLTLSEGDEIKIRYQRFFNS